MSSVFLSIANFIIQLQAADGGQITCDEGHQPYVCQPKEKSDVIVVAHRGAYPDQLTNQNRLYKAVSDGQLFWEIFKLEHGFLLITYVQDSNLKTIQQVVDISEDYQLWNVYSHSGNPMDPMSYPLGPLILYMLTTQHEALMVHASGVAHNGKGHLFSAVSGTGKSTMAHLWEKCGACIINDDRLIIRRSTDGYELHNTPMYYKDSPRSTKLSSIHLIYQNKTGHCTPIGGATALAKVMGNTILHNYNPKHIKHHLKFISELTQAIPCYETGFAIDTSIVEFIQRTVREAHSSTNNINS